MAHFRLTAAEIAFDPRLRAASRDLLHVRRCGRHHSILEKRKAKCDPVADLGWVLLTHLSLPGGGKFGLYQPEPWLHQKMESSLCVKLVISGHATV